MTLKHGSVDHSTFLKQFGEKEPPPPIKPKMFRVGKFPVAFGKFKIHWRSMP